MKCLICNKDMVEKYVCVGPFGTEEEMYGCTHCKKYTYGFAYGHTEHYIGHVVVHEIHDMSDAERKIAKEIIECAVSKYKIQLEEDPLI